MGFLIKYSHLIHLSMTEGDVNGSSIDGIDIFPLGACQRLLENFKMVFRKRKAGFDIYFSETPLVPINSRVRFSFGLSISDPALFTRYGLVKKDDTDTKVYEPGLYFDNLKADGSIITGSPASLVSSGTDLDQFTMASDTFKIYPLTFHTFIKTGSTIPSQFELDHKYETSLKRTYPVVAAPGMDYIVTTINSPSEGNDYIRTSGAFTLKADTDSPPNRNVYLSSEVGGPHNVQGVVDLYWDAPQNTVSDPEKGQEYHIIFKPKEEH